MNMRYLLIGGVGALAVGAYFLLGRNSSESGASPYSVPLVIGSGTTSTDATTTTASTDDSISQLLSGQLALATIQQQTDLAGYHTQTDLANIAASSALDLAKLDLSKTKVLSLSNVWTSIFGSSGSLNTSAPSNQSYGLDGGSVSSGRGYTQGSIYGTVGFDADGNIAVNVNRQTASSKNPLPAAGVAGTALSGLAPGQTALTQPTVTTSNRRRRG